MELPFRLAMHSPIDRSSVTCTRLDFGIFRRVRFALACRTVPLIPLYAISKRLYSEGSGTIRARREHVAGSPVLTGGGPHIPARRDIGYLGALTASNAGAWQAGNCPECPPLRMRLFVWLTWRGISRECPAALNPRIGAPAIIPCMWI